MKTVFIREDETRGVEIIINSFQRIFKLFSYVGQIELGPVRIRGSKDETGKYSGAIIVKGFRVEVEPDKLYIDLGDIRITAESGKDMIIVFSSKAEVTMRDADISIGVAEITAAEFSLNVFRTIKLSSESAVLQIGELLIKGCGSFIVQAADMTFKGNDFSVAGKNMSLKAMDSVSLSSVKGGLAMAGGTGVTISASPFVKKPTAGKFQVEAATVELGMAPQFSAAVGDHVVSALNSLLTTLTATATALSGAAIEPAAKAAGGALTGGLGALGPLLNPIKSVSIKVSP